jgi:hypothetical protein
VKKTSNLDFIELRARITKTTVEFNASVMTHDIALTEYYEHHF